MERISWGGGLFNHRKVELRELISQKKSYKVSWGRGPNQPEEGGID